MKLTKMHLVVAIALGLYLCSVYGEKKEKGTVYTTGEILLPDYAITDTLVVTDGRGLTEAIKNCDKTDLGIAEACRLYTKIK